MAQQHDPDEHSTFTLRATVHGRVQGVGFRFFVRNAAKHLHLAGYVKNQADGSVHVFASGPRHALMELLSILRHGPDGVYVSKVEQEWGAGDSRTADSGFEVRV